MCVASPHKLYRMCRLVLCPSIIWFPPRAEDSPLTARDANKASTGIGDDIYSVDPWQTVQNVCLDCKVSTASLGRRHKKEQRRGTTVGNEPLLKAAGRPVSWRRSGGTTLAAAGVGATARSRRAARRTRLVFGTHTVVSLGTARHGTRSLFTAVAVVGALVVLLVGGGGGVCCGGGRRRVRRLVAGGGRGGGLLGGRRRRALGFARLVEVLHQVGHFLVVVTGALAASATWRPRSASAAQLTAHRRVTSECTGSNSKHGPSHCNQRVVNI